MIPRLLQTFWLLAGTLALFAMPAESAEMRQFNAIQSPAQVASLLPVGATPVTNIQPVPPAAIERTIRQFAAAWNTPDVNNFIAADFFDKSLFGDAFANKVPRDATLRVQSIQGIQTLQQALVTAPSGERQLISTVVATANTQIEFNDPTLGFVSLTGTNDYFLEVVEVVE